VPVQKASNEPVARHARSLYVPAVDCGEHAFLTAPGSAYARFRRSLDNGSVNALAAAAELKPLGLTHSLELLLYSAIALVRSTAALPYAGTPASFRRSTSNSARAEPFLLHWPRLRASERTNAAHALAELLSHPLALTQRVRLG
jgi:hypothetical protein